MENLIPVAGVKLGVAKAGLRNKVSNDVMILTVSPGSTISGVFTNNSFKAAPVIIASGKLKQGRIRALVVNSGYANAGTGERGKKDAEQVCKQLADAIGVSSEQVLPFSTGIIMEPLPVKKIVNALAAGIKTLKSDNWRAGATAIMTTDKVSKGVSSQIEVDSKTITVTGIAKGSGMIHPNMATMLGFIATDASINKDTLDKMISEITQKSFNCITVDGDTSTNDSFILIATGASAAQPIENKNSPNYKIIYEAIQDVAIELAKMIVRDGEGATKLVTVEVVGGGDKQECKEVAYSVAKSPLVKTAFFAEDPNLGRILAAIGAATIVDVDWSKIKMWIDDLLVFEGNEVVPGYDEKIAKNIMSQSNFRLKIDLRRGSASTEVWTCDLSREYITINAEYRS